MITIPVAAEYKRALSEIEINDYQRAMLRAHFEAPNRTITYTQLAAAGGYATHQSADANYGRLGFNLGNALGIEFADSEDRPGEKFYSSAIGMKNAYATKDDHFQLVMHHELAKAVSELGWFTE